MYNTGVCPTCQSNIAEDRLNEEVVVCQACGWMNNQTEKKSDKIVDKKFLKLSLTIAVLLSAFFVHTTKWASYSVEIIPLKIKQVISANSVQDLQRIVEICESRANSECLEDSYLQLSQKDTQNIENIANYAKLSAFNGKINFAVSAYDRYFEKGGNDINHAYDYAKLLGKLGKFERSVDYFEIVLQAKPNTMQITVTHAYVEMLTKAGRYEDAKNVIMSIRKKGANASYFMESQLNMINKALKRG